MRLGEDRRWVVGDTEEEVVVVAAAVAVAAEEEEDMERSVVEKDRSLRHKATVVDQEDKRWGSHS